MEDYQRFQHIIRLILQKFTESDDAILKILLYPQRTLHQGYQDDGDELQNSISEITEMRDPSFFIISVGQYSRIAECTM